MSVRLRLVRHGTAVRDAADVDPGLDAVGAKEALALAARFNGERPGRLASSPLRRARETAVPLAAAFRLAPEIEPAYAELPWRSGQSPGERYEELRRTLSASWADLSPDRRRWRDELVSRALAETLDAIIVTHFIAINALVGAATADDRVVVFRPQTTSVTEIEVSDGRLTLVSLGSESDLPLIG